MVQIRKRRTFWSHFRLPVGVLVLLLLVSKLATIGRAVLISQLEQHIAQGDTQEALAAVFQLVEMRPAPAGALVAAAASTNPEIAAGTKSTIDILLDEYDGQIQNNRRLGEVAESLVALAEALAEQQKSFTATSQAWVAQTTRQLVRLANQLPDAVAPPSLAVRCEAILDAVHAASPPLIATRRPAVFDPGVAAAVVVANPFTPTNQTNLLRTTSPRGKSPPGNAPLSSSSRPSNSNVAATPSPITKPVPMDWQRPRTNPSSVNAAPITMRIVPTQPIDTATIDNDTPTLPLARVTPKNATQSLVDFEPAQLLNLWHTTTGADAAAIEMELARRGFGRLSRRLVEQFFSNRPTDRLQLVDDALSSPGVGAQPWLLLLAADTHADVRLAAITALATSNDPALLEKVYQVAIRDRDPRIADLAARLNQRRNGETHR